MVNEGYIVSDKNRQAVFVELMSGEGDLERIIKKHRLIERAGRRAMEDLVDQGLAEEQDGGYSLTADGERLGQDLKKNGLIR